jgi:glycosyltransferase involved in cell wall biosynthesis
MSAELASTGAVPGEAPLSGRDAGRDPRSPDLSIVMPCLNEEDSVGICVRKAWEGISATGLTGEVIVADNGSSDRSVAVAEAAGARVVHQPHRGYGNAYLKGFAAARGRIIVMGDSDDSYDFTRISDLIKPIEDGCDYVLGSRFAGHIDANAMPWSHRRIGNPALTAVLNALFRLRVTDAHSGFRAITRVALDKIALQSEGMEFASEIVVKAALADLRTAEVPISYHPRIGVSKLHSLRDGWRHLRFLFLHSPDYLFLLPGLILTVLGIIGQVVMVAAPANSYALFTKITLALIALAGSQLLAMGTFAVMHARDEGQRGRKFAFGWTERIITPERGPVLASALALVGLPLVAAPFLLGAGSQIGAGGKTSSEAIGGLLLIVLGGKLWFDALFVRLVTLRRPGGAVAAAYPATAAARDQAGGAAEPASAVRSTDELGATV